MPIRSGQLKFIFCFIQIFRLRKFTPNSENLNLFKNRFESKDHLIIDCLESKKFYDTNDMIQLVHIKYQLY